MTTWIAACLVLVGLAGASLAQPAPPAPAPAAAPTAAPVDAPPPAPSATEMHPVASPAEARTLCAAAMNADPKFAAEIVKIADGKAAAERDADTLKAHQDAYFHIQKNERHVIYAYAGMWILAAGFVIYLWRRQQAIRAEIAHLRRDLDAAADGNKPAGSAP